MDYMSYLPLLIMLVSLVASVFIMLSGKKPNLREFWTFLAATIKFGLVICLASHVAKGFTPELLLWEALPNLPIAFKVDGFGALFAIVASSLWILTSMYSVGYMRPLKEHAQTRYFACFALALSATMGVAFSANLFTMYLFYELLSLSTYPLVTHNQDADARTGGRKYLTYLLGTSIGLLLPALIITYQTAGTLTFSAAGVFTQVTPDLHMLGLLLLFVFGFAKAGLMPFHSWLPGAMVAPTPVSSLLHAVAVVKVGVFCIVRVITGIFGMELLVGTQLSTVVAIIASFTVITSSLIALSQDNLKRRLAFSTVGQLAYIILGVSLATSMGVVGSMAHIGMHAFGKITLFFCAGAIYVATGKKYISQMVGIGRKMPLTMTAFFFGSLSVIGLPPAGGLITKWYMVNGAIQAQMTWVVVVYLISTLLNAAYFLPIVYKAFFCTPEESQFDETQKEPPLFAVLPPVITAIACVILFFNPEIFLNLARLSLGS